MEKLRPVVQDSLHVEFRRMYVKCNHGTFHEFNEGEFFLYSREDFNEGQKQCVDNDV